MHAVGDIETPFPRHGHPVNLRSGFTAVQWSSTAGYDVALHDVRPPAEQHTVEQCRPNMLGSAIDVVNHLTPTCGPAINAHPLKLAILLHCGVEVYRLPL